MTHDVQSSLPQLRALNILTQLPPGRQQAQDHLCALACCLTGADAAAVVILDDSGAAHVLGQDGTPWTLCPLTAEEAAGQVPLEAGHALRSGAIDRLTTVGLWPLRIEGALVGALVAGQRHGPGDGPTLPDWAATAAAKLRPLAELSANQIAAELAMARLARMAQAAFGRGESPS